MATRAGIEYSLQPDLLSCSKECDESTLHHAAHTYRKKGTADDALNDLGVSSPFHCFKIQYLFKCLLLKTPTAHVVNDFSAANKEGKYVQRLAEEGVDGDMLLEILQLETNVSICKELEITRVDALKIKQWLKPSEDSKQ